MHFDKIIMNPPYDGNLHLKILQKAIKYSDDVVNLSPIRWLQDPLAEYKKNSDFKKFEDIRKRIENIDIIPTEVANRLFDIGLLQPLGIYHITKDGGYDIKQNMCLLKIIKKINEENNFSKMKIVNYNDTLENYLCLNIMAPPMKYGKPMFDWIKQTGVCDSKNTYRDWKDKNPAATRGDVSNTLCVCFDTKEEAQNCYDTFNTKFAKWCCSNMTVDIHVNPKFAPWFSDYTHPWTDKQIYEYFELTDDEIKEIEQEIK